MGKDKKKTGKLNVSDLYAEDAGRTREGGAREVLPEVHSFLGLGCGASSVDVIKAPEGEQALETAEIQSRPHLGGASPAPTKDCFLLLPSWALY